MTPPQGYSKAKPGQVCKLLRSLYELKQAGRQWNQELSGRLQNFGFTQSSVDHCLFTKRETKTFTALLVYVDDLLITGNDDEEIKSVKGYLHRIFRVKDLGEARYFLRLEITWGRGNACEPKKIRP